jgi:hypothetical protein
MGMAELVVAICLQAEPSNCRVFHQRQASALSGCAVVEDNDELTVKPGWYLARWTCRWRR